MKSRTGKKPELGIFEFGESLLKTGDLDPVYILLWEADFEPLFLQRWLIAYWCFYHMGSASWIAEGRGESGFWERMSYAASTRDIPRCTERRHFRGTLAAKSVSYLRERGVQELFRPFITHPFSAEGDMSLPDAMGHVLKWVGFGPWIAFKVADMLERLDLCPIRFEAEDIYLFDSPRDGARIAWERHGVGPTPDSVEAWAVAWLSQRFKTTLAPPREDRAFGPPEAETILCKWKSYLGGSYHLGEDIEGTRKSLLRFSTVRTSQRLLKAGNGRLW